MTDEKLPQGARETALTKDEEIPCRICEKPTRMLGTKLCDRCWELESRIHMDPEIAVKILKKLGLEIEPLTDPFWSLMQSIDRQHN